MNTQDEKDIRNPFPEPQTIPSGWDTSVFSSTSEPVSVSEEDDSAES
jgi:hypothetical protein